MDYARTEMLIYGKDNLVQSVISLNLKQLSDPDKLLPLALYFQIKIRNISEFENVLKRQNSN